MIELFYIVVSIIIIITTSIYLIFLNDSISNISIETKNQNIAEIIWMWISMSVIILVSVLLLCIHFLVLRFNPNDLLILFSSFSLINVSIVYDFFARNELNTRFIELILIFDILLFIKSLDYFCF